MKTARRFLFLIALTLFALSLTVPSAAVDEPETTEATTETTVAGEQEGQEEGAGANVPPPAVTVPDTAGGEEDVDWTYRYLVPTLLALAVIVVIITTVQYFVRVVRSRYKVVE